MTNSAGRTCHFTVAVEVAATPLGEPTTAPAPLVPGAARDATGLAGGGSHAFWTAKTRWH